MKIDLKRFEGRELHTGAEEPKSIGNAYAGDDQSRDHRWMAVVGVPIAIGGICAFVSWHAFLTFLVGAGATIVLLGAAVAWIDKDTTPFV